MLRTYDDAQSTYFFKQERRLTYSCKGNCKYSLDLPPKRDFDSFFRQLSRRRERSVGEKGGGLKVFLNLVGREAYWRIVLTLRFCPPWHSYWMKWSSLYQVSILYLIGVGETLEACFLFLKLGFPGEGRLTSWSTLVWSFLPFYRFIRPGTFHGSQRFIVITLCYFPQFLLQSFILKPTRIYELA